MKISASHSYPCSMEELFQRFCEPDFYVRKFEACGARKIVVENADNDDGRFTITVVREVPADVPGMLKSFLGEWNTITQTETWEGEPGDEYYNDLEIKAEGVPVQITGSMNLTEDGDGCVNDVEFDIQCGIPLIGKKLAEFVAADTEKTLAAEYEFIQDEIER